MTKFAVIFKQENSSESSQAICHYKRTIEFAPNEVASEEEMIKRCAVALYYANAEYFMEGDQMDKLYNGSYADHLLNPQFVSDVLRVAADLSIVGYFSIQQGAPEDVQNFIDSLEDNELFVDDIDFFGNGEEMIIKP